MKFCSLTIRVVDDYGRDPACFGGFDSLGDSECSKSCDAKEEENEHEQPIAYFGGFN